MFVDEVESVPELVPVEAESVAYAQLDASSARGTPGVSETTDGARRCVQDHPLTVESVEQREACYARFQETRVAGASELSETDRLREQLRLARAASAKDGASGE